VTTEPEPESSAPARTIDLDAARKARTEKLGPAPKIRLNGVDYELPAELPMEPILQIADGLFDKSMADEDKPDAMRAALKALLGEHYEAIRVQLSAQDASTLLRGILDLYGTDLPERSASATS
jgi:hypothetical protein